MKTFAAIAACIALAAGPALAVNDLQDSLQPVIDATVEPVQPAPTCGRYEDIREYDANFERTPEGACAGKIFEDIWLDAANGG